MLRIWNVRCVAVLSFAVLLFAAAIVPSSAYPQERGGSAPPREGQTPAEYAARIEDELGRSTVVEVVEMSLEELLVTDLAERHNILIVLDKLAIEEAGVTKDVPVT